MARVITALNGQLPQSALAPIGGGFYLRKDAAASYLAARSAGCPWGVNTAYRTLAEQAKLYDKYLAGGSLAAKPGKSWHGEGLALDIPSSSGAQQWLLSHPEYGWRRTVMPAEPWHFEFFPALYSAGGDVNLTDKLGVNPATKKSSTVGEKLDIASNYAFYTWQLVLELKSVVSQIAEATGTDIDYARIERAVTDAIAKGIDVDVTVTQR